MTGKSIGGATCGFKESLLSGNDAGTVAKDTVMGGVSGGLTGGLLAGAAYGAQKGVSAIGNAIKGKTAPTNAEPAKSVLDGGICSWDKGADLIRLESDREHPAGR